MNLNDESMTPIGNAHRHPLARTIRYGFFIYLLFTLLYGFGKWMASQIIYDDCKLLSQEVIDSTADKVSELGGSLVSFERPSKVKFIPGKALICTANFEGVGKMPSGTYQISKDRRAVYWSIGSSGTQSSGFNFWQNEYYNLQRQEAVDATSSQVQERIEEAKENNINFQ
jgi:hypothetical protein